MSIHFNAQEIFDVAERLERRGARFYQLAAQASGNAACRKLFLDLAEMEDRHEQIFSAIGKNHEQPPGNLDTVHWQAVAAILLNNLDQDLQAHFAGACESGDILREALAFEKDTIVFFLALKEMAPRPRDRLQIDEIIKEELGHTLLLASELIQGKH